MATICDMDLQPNTETSVRLIHWDYVNGNDTVLIIHDNKSVEKVMGYDDDDEPITEEVNLFETLQALL